MTTAYPLSWPEGWPRSPQRKAARFSKSDWRAGYGSSSYRVQRELSIADATKRVLEELQRLGVPYGEWIISTNLELRLDGLPRSGQAAPADPGVAVYWQRPGETMKVMAIDIYDRAADNLAAVAATLNAMRAIERHGGAQILERAFTGFTALPPPGTSRPWWEVLGMADPALRRSRDAILDAYRMQAKKAHPDAGGSDAAMAEINAARDEALRGLAS